MYKCDLTMKPALPIILFLTLMVSFSAESELRIEVTKGVDNAVRVAVVPFGWRGRGRLPQEVTDVINADLRLSGRFYTLPVEQMLSLPRHAGEVFFRDWRLLNIDYLVLGNLQRSEN